MKPATKKKVLLISFITLAAAIVTAAVLVFTFMPANVRTPGVVGRTYQQASDDLKKAGLKVERSEAFSTTVPKDAIISQSIKPGTKLKKGQSVKVVVSAGIEQVKLPNVANCTLEEAEAKLRSLGLEVSVGEEKYYYSVPKDCVISQSVLPGTMVDKGSEISLTISKGPELVAMPKLTGGTLQNAKAALAAVGLNFKITYKVSQTVREDDVISQDTAPGTTTEKGSEVAIVVSLGKTVNTAGNTAANLNNGGLAAAQGNWVYAVIKSGELVKINKATGEITELYWGGSGVQYVNVVGEWVYYLYGGTIYKIRIDGSDPQRVFHAKEYVDFMLVREGYIYYAATISAGVDGGIYRLKTDGTGLKKICDGDCLCINVTGNFIYYIKKSVLYRVNADGTNNMPLPGQVYYDYIDVQNDAIYFIDYMKNLYKTDLKSNSEQFLAKSVMYINVSGSWIYYLDENYVLCKMKTDGSQQSVVGAGTEMSLIYVVGDRIVYLLPNNIGIYESRLDGTGEILLGTTESAG